MLAQGASAAEACRRIASSEQTYCHWRKEYGGLKTDQARRMQDLEKENLRLRRAVPEPFIATDLHLTSDCLATAACNPVGSVSAPCQCGKRSNCKLDRCSTWKQYTPRRTIAVPSSQAQDHSRCPIHN